MTIIQQPATQEVAMNMTEFIIDTDSTINFSVKYGGKTILSEDYVPDANWQVHTQTWQVPGTGFMGALANKPCV